MHLTRIFYVQSYICVWLVLKKRNISRSKTNGTNIIGPSTYLHNAPLSPYYPVAFFNNIVVSSLKRDYGNLNFILFPFCSVHTIRAFCRNRPRLSSSLFIPNTFRSLCFPSISIFVSGPLMGCLLLFGIDLWIHCFCALWPRPTQLVFNFLWPLQHLPRPKWISYFVVRPFCKFQLKMRKTCIQSANKSNNIKSYVHKFTGSYPWRLN